MKDIEFIELLNLYLDHEISPADAARLEAEVQKDPARRRVYQQYCRMQKACKLLASEFETEVTPADAEKIVAFKSDVAGPGFRRALYTLGGFAAAAACVAIIFVGRGRQEASTPAAPASSEFASVAPIAPASPTAIAAKSILVAESAPAAKTGGIQRAPSTLVADPLMLTTNAQAETLLAKAAEQANEQFQWIAALQIAPLQQRVPAEELRFDVRPATLRPEARVLGNRPPAEATVEMTAFRFVK